MVFEQGAVRCSRECDVAVTVYRTWGGGHAVQSSGLWGERQRYCGGRGERLTQLENVC